MVVPAQIIINVKLKYHESFLFSKKRKIINGKTSERADCLVRKDNEANIPAIIYAAGVL
jgi:hypothetical protein